MGSEIERKFLVGGHGLWRDGAEGELYRQGYLAVDPDRTVRVRVAGDRGYLTVKGRTEGLVRAEYEYQIPVADADEMLDRLCLHPLIEKTRYRLEYHGHVWEIDEFAGDNLGLITAEVELADPAEPVDLPDWLGAEVSHDPRYSNANLVRNPYCRW